MGREIFSLANGLHHRSGIVRKSCAMVLQGAKQLTRVGVREADYAARPPVLANSFPKSGTHLLDQIIEALPGRRNFGTFLASQTSSFQFRLRSEEETCGIIKRIVPGEIVRGHLFHSLAVSEALRRQRVVHFLIYRDPRDVVISEAHYVRFINRWHKLHPVFRAEPTLEAAVTLAIRGLGERAPAAGYGDVAQRFGCFEAWLNDPDVCAIKYEDLMSGDRDQWLVRIASFYRDRAATDLDVPATVSRMRANIAPERSHTFRKGKAGGWRESLTSDQRDAFKSIAGDLLIRLGYERDLSW